MDVYDIDDTVQIRTYSAAGEGFTDEAGALTDPTTVTLRIREPDGTLTSVTYAGAQVVKDSTGRYHYNFRPDQAGVHHYRWIGTGAVTAAFEGAFHVRKQVA